MNRRTSDQTDATDQASPRSPETNPAAVVDLDSSRRRQPGALPHERDQRPSDQAADADQDQTARSAAAFDDARRGRPDTSAAPLLRQPSPADRRSDER